LRDEIYAQLALSRTFVFLATCQTIHAEARDLVRRHGVYHITCLVPKRTNPEPPRIYMRKYPTFPLRTPSPYLNPRLDLLQNLHVTQYPRSTTVSDPQDLWPWKMLLKGLQSAGVRRRICHWDLRSEDVDRTLGIMLQVVRGFEVVRVQQSGIWSIGDPRWGPDDTQAIAKCVGHLKRLFRDELGEVVSCTTDEVTRDGTLVKSVLLEFHPSGLR